MAQDFYEILQVFDYIVDRIDDHKAELGIKYIAKHEENLIPEYPAVLVQTANLRREHWATQMFRVEFDLNIWIFHADLTEDTATRSRTDIELATAMKRFLHSDYTLGGHVVDSYVSGEYPGIMARVIDANLRHVVATRLTWTAQNRVPFQAL